MGFVMSHFYKECMDVAKPDAYFARQGWTAAGARPDDIDAQRVCATARAATMDARMDAEIRASQKPMKAMKRPAAVAP